MKTAVIQMVSGTVVADNLALASQWLEQASTQGAELVVLPEYFCLMAQQDNDRVAAQETWGHGQVQDFLSSCAQRLGFWLVGGTLPLSTCNDPTRVHNSCLVYAPSGQCVARYDKMHLFRFARGPEYYDESQSLVAGTQPVAFDLPSRDGHTYRVGLSICYDLRFGHLYRALAADVLLVPSAFTATTGRAHWEVLLRARAIENLAYVLAAAQGGEHANGRKTWGHSCVIDPWGQVLAQHESGAGLILADISRSRLDAVRQQLPSALAPHEVGPQTWSTTQ